jgi:uncharacterized protein (DUF2267 family)
MELQHASEDFEKFLTDAMAISGLATRNQTYTMVQGVFQVFRRRLDLKDAIRFANALPPILRAIFVDDWNTDELQLAFFDRRAMTKEAQLLRKDHNFSPDTCIRDVAAALRKNVNEASFNRILQTLPQGASEFWVV